MSEGMAFTVFYTGAWEEVSWKHSRHRQVVPIARIPGPSYCQGHPPQVICEENQPASQLGAW